MQINPGHYPAYFNRGTDRQRLGDYAGALTNLTTYLPFAPTDPAAYTARGYGYLARSDQQAAERDAEQARALFEHQRVSSGAE